AERRVPGAEPPSAIGLLWAVKVPLRAGVRLKATIFKPRPQPEPLPVVFTLTPYVADTYYARAQYFARRGYVFALVDVRGRGNSEGTFVPFENEAKDGHDVVEWLPRQPRADGKVAMWGGAYAGVRPGGGAEGGRRRHDRARGGRRGRRGLPVLQQHLGSVHRAVADVHERRHAEPEPLPRPDVLDRAIPGALPRPPAVQGVRRAGRQPVGLVPEDARAPAARRLLEGDASHRGAVRGALDPDPHDHPPLP